MKILHQGQTYHIHRDDSVEVRVRRAGKWGVMMTQWRMIPRNGKTAVAVRKIRDEFVALQATEEG